MTERLPPSAGEAIDRSTIVTFTVDRKRIRAFEGDSIGSAMAAAGITITGRSFKYHRPRGLMCMAGACPNCNGAGVIYTDLGVMAGVSTVCEVCEGRRFDQSVLEYTLGGRDISQVAA